MSDPPTPPALATMLVSTAFNLDTMPTPGLLPDCELMSSDDVVFYVNNAQLLRASSTGFGHEDGCHCTEPTQGSIDEGQAEEGSEGGRA